MSDARSNRNEAERAGSYRDSIVWQKAMRPVRPVYELSRGFPSIEEVRRMLNALRRKPETPRP